MGNGPKKAILNLVRIWIKGWIQEFFALLLTFAIFSENNTWISMRWLVVAYEDVPVGADPNKNPSYFLCL